MAMEDYLSLMFLALTSLGAVFITPFFIEGIIMGFVLLIVAWKWFNDNLLVKFNVEDLATTTIILFTTLLGIHFIFKGSIFFMFMGISYILISFGGLQKHLRFLYQIDKR